MQRRKHLESVGLSAGLLFGTGGGAGATADSSTAPSRYPNRIISSLEELQETFGANGNLNDGEHVHISGEGAPYRTTQWLDIDASNVTVTGSGPRPLIKPANGANVGGFRIGYNSHAESVSIQGISYDGNPSGQTLSKGGFGIGSFDAKNVSIEGCDIRRTVPYHKHNHLNSGVTIHKGTYGFHIENNHFEDIGDRAIEAAGHLGYIGSNTSKNGFDRMVSVTSRGSDSGGNHIVIHGNRLDTNAEGSMIGLSNFTREAHNIVISGNIATGKHHRLIRVGDLADQTSLVIANNIGDGREAVSEGIEVDTADAVISNNHLYGYRRAGVEITAHRTLVQGNRIEECGAEGIRFKAATLPLSKRAARENGGFRSVAQGNTLVRNSRKQSEGAEVSVNASQVRVTNNHVLDLNPGRVCFNNSLGKEAIFAWNTAPPYAQLFGEKTQSARVQGNIN